MTAGSQIAARRRQRAPSVRAAKLRLGGGGPLWKNRARISTSADVRSIHSLLATCVVVLSEIKDVLPKLRAIKIDWPKTARDEHALTIGDECAGCAN